MAEPVPAFVVHALPGRVRLRLPALRGDMAGLSALALAIAELPGVTTAQVFAVSGSLLVLHQRPLGDLLGDAMAGGLLAVQGTPPPAAGAPAVPPQALLPAAGALAAAGLALVQLLRREALPPALTLGWHAVALAQVALQRGLLPGGLGASAEETPAAEA